MYHQNITLTVEHEYAMNIKYDLMKDNRFIITQNPNNRSAYFKTIPGKYEEEYIFIHLPNNINSAKSTNRGMIIDQIKRATKIYTAPEPKYSIEFNLAAFDTILCALDNRPNPEIEAEIMNGLLPCAQTAPSMFFDKLIHRLPPEVQLDYLFRMDEFVQKKNEKKK